MTRPELFPLPGTGSPATTDIDRDTALRLFEAAFEQEAMGMGLRAVGPRDSRWLRVNNKLCAILGYTREELLRLTSIDITLPEERYVAIAFNERLLRGDVSSYSREKRYVRKDGRVIWTNVWLSVVLGPDGKPSQVISVIEDITERKRAEIARLEAENRFRSVVDVSPAGITLKDREGRFLVVNRTYSGWMDLEPSELLGKTAHEVFAKAEADDIRANDLKTMDAGRELVGEAVRRFKDGRQRHLMFHKSPVFSASGEPVAVSTILTDITARIRAEEAVRERERRFRDFAESASDWFWETDAELRFTYLTHRFYENTGFRSGDPRFGLLPRDYDRLAKNVEDPEWARHVADLTARRPFKNFERRFEAPDGTVRYARISGTPVYDGDGTFQGYRGTGTDITEAYNLSQKLSWQASHDALTNLINRREFERRLERVLQSTRFGTDEHALCYLDLDQFKVINDTCGHMAGDELLRQIGQLLPGVVRKRDTLARLGGDEFGLLMEHCSVEQALRVADGLREQVDALRFTWNGQTFRIGVSIGLVPIRNVGWDVPGVLSVADSACYAAKDEGRNRVHLYRPEDVEFARRHGEMRWVARINQALEDDRFQLWSQLIQPLTADAEDGEHIELLLRMLDNEGRCIKPGSFLPAADRFGLSTKLDRWVIGSAFSWLGRNPRRLERMALCSINLSGPTLSDKDVLNFVQQQLESMSIPARKVCFEITETAAIANMNQALHFVTTLKALGVRFSLDDFGSGLSSFGYLKTLPVDYLKIDGVFVRDILEDPVDLALVRSINDIGKVMGKRTMAEFVESDEILGRLREIGVDYVQGYCVGRPEPLGDEG